LKRNYCVQLNDVLVGYLTETDEGVVYFRMVDGYREMPHRPVLSQFFEDDLNKIYKGKRGALPAFFENLLPEGPLRELVEKSLQLEAPDELALIEALGSDLPGAVIIRQDENEIFDRIENGDDDLAQSDTQSDSNGVGIRFSLAGVQMKFSVARAADRLTLPAHGKGGEWIVKLDSSAYPKVPENEYATLEWARAAGFNVPECELQQASSLASPLDKYVKDLDSNVLVIRRYDRKEGKRIHQEDFAQVVGLNPKLKYDHITYEQCANLVLRIAGTDEYFEFIRRLAFMVATGNTDAHLKNWSFIYGDGIHAKLAPMYDQVCTIAWPDVSRDLSLKLASVKPLLKIDEDAFARLARSIGADSDKTVSVLRESLFQIARAWRESKGKEIMPKPHIDELESYWKRAPLLKQFAGTFIDIDKTRSFLPVSV